MRMQVPRFINNCILNEAEIEGCFNQLFWLRSIFLKIIISVLVLDFELKKCDTISAIFYFNKN